MLLLIISEIVKVKWNARNKKRYEELGYKFTRIGEEFDVKVEHLSRGSIAIINIRCDYCGNEYSIMYQTRVNIQKKAVSKKDCCCNQPCIDKKIMESNGIKYGVNHHIRADSVQKKISETLIRKYGVQNVFQLETVKERSRETSIEKYGSEWYTQTEEHKKRVKKTSLRKYGHESHMQHPKYREMFKGENSPVWKGGAAHHRIERATGEYQSWRKMVFGRDKYRCQCCGAKQGEVDFQVELHAHHIINWKDCKELRYNVDNGITFCHDCHLKFHSIYGKKKNNIGQVNEFITNLGKNLYRTSDKSNYF